MAQGPKTWDRWKDPQEVLDLGINWTEEVEDLDITVSVWSLTVAAGLAIEDDSFNNADTDEDGNPAKTTTVRLSGGTLGETAELLNHITLDDGQEFEQTCKVKIKKR